LEWTYIITGGFYDFLFSLGTGFDPKGHKALIAGDGNARLFGADVADIAKYTVAILLDPETKNKKLFAYTESFTWNEAVKIFEEVSGKKFEVTYESIEDLHKVPQNPDADFHTKILAHIKAKLNNGEDFPASDAHKYKDIKPLSIKEKAKQINGQ